MFMIITYHRDTLFHVIHELPPVSVASMTYSVLSFFCSSLVGLLYNHIAHFRAYTIGWPANKPINTCYALKDRLYLIGMNQSGGKHATIHISLPAKTIVYCTNPFTDYIGSFQRDAIVPADLPAVA